MLRALLTIILAPVAITVVWLSLGERGGRADFVVASGPLRTIDPHRVSWLDEIQISAALFEGLTRLDPQNYQPRPGAAELLRIATGAFARCIRQTLLGRPRLAAADAGPDAGPVGVLAGQ